jgi:hypothetical protein
MDELWSASTVIFRLPFQALCCFKRTVYSAVRYTPRASYPFKPVTPSPVDHSDVIRGLGWLSDLRSEDPLPAEHGGGRSDLIDLVGRNRQRVAIEHDEVGQLPSGDRALPVLTAGDVRAGEGVGA